MRSVTPWLACQVLKLQEACLGRTTFSILRTPESPDRSSREALQRDKLQSLLTHATSEIPYWRERLDSCFPGAGAFDALSRAPILTRTQIRQDAQSMLWTGCPGKILQHRSGGTTDDNLTFFWGRERQSWDRAMRYRGLLGQGIHPGEAVIHLWPRYPVRGTLDRLKVIARDLRDRLTNDVVVDLRPFDDARLDRALRLCHGYRPVLLISYPSWLIALAKRIRAVGAGGAFSRLQRVMCTGEGLFDFQRRFLAETFGVPIFQEYGSQDSGVLAHEDASGVLRLHADQVILEVLRDGNPAPPGELGEVVITHLHNRVMPFIRYATGDVMRGPASSESGNSTERPRCPLPEGRTSDQLVTMEGKLCPMRPVIEALVEQAGLEEFSLHQPEPGAITLLYVEGPGQPPPHEPAEEVLRRFLGQDLVIGWVGGKHFVPLTSGKKRYVCSPAAMRLLAHDRQAGLHLARSWPQRLVVG
jgi:phenylacetate-CoA ligase